MAPFGSLLAGALAHEIGAPLTVILSRRVLHRGRGMVYTQLPSIRKLMRPIYMDLGILPPVNAVIQESLGHEPARRRPFLLATLGGIRSVRGSHDYGERR